MPYEDLPAWMRRTRRAVDWPLMLVLVLGAALTVPVFIQPSLPWSLGLRSEVARALAISESIQAGVLYPRWAADFNLGYGSPLWNFLPPLPHYLAGLHRVLAETSAEFSVKLVLAGALILLTLGLFSFARRRWGTYAGLLAVALGLFSPQVAQVKPILEADTGALLAGGFCLLSLWALDRLLASWRGLDLVLASGTCAAVWLAHQPLNLIFGALILAWLLLRHGAPSDQNLAARYGLLAYVLGFLASAFYWLPAWSERHMVHWQPALDPALTARGSVSLRDVFGWLAPLDRAAINPLPTPAIGMALWVAAAVALLVILAPRLAGLMRTGTRRHGASRLRAGERETLLFGLAATLLLIAALPPLGDRWAGMVEWPPFEPPDLIFPAAICLALAGASLGHLLEFHRPPRQGVAGMATLAVVIAAAGMPALSIPSAPNLAPPLSPASLVQSEARGVPLTAREPGWLLPRAIQSLPPVAPALVASYQSGAVDKIVRENLPATTLVDMIEHVPQGERILVRSAEVATISLQTFMFDGWRARLDGVPAPIRASEPAGLITLQVPEGRHELLVYFGTTSARVGGWALSGAACLLLIALAVHLEHGAPTRTEREAHAIPLNVRAGSGSGKAEAGVMIVLLVVLAGGAVLARLQPEWFSIQSPRGEVLPAETRLPRAFQGGVDLLAYEFERRSDPAASIALTLYWRGWRPDLPDYQVDLHLVSLSNASETYPLAQRRHPGLLPSSEWPRWPLLSHYVRDSYELSIPNDVPPGRYQIAVRVGRCSQLEPAPCAAIAPLFVHDGKGTSLGQAATLPDVVVVTR